MNTATKTAPERIREWVEGYVAPRYVDAVTEELIDVATGNQPPTIQFHRNALRTIFPEWYEED